jgi:hypothetical protein
MEKSTLLDEMLKNVSDLNVAVKEFETKREKLLPKIDLEIKELKKSMSFLQIKETIKNKVEDLRAETIKNVEILIEFNKYGLKFDKFFIKDLENVLKMIKAIFRINKVKASKFVDFINSKDMTKKENFEAVKDALKMVKKLKKENTKKTETKKSEKSEPLKIENNEIIETEIIETETLLIENKSFKNEIATIKEKLKKGKILSKKEREFLINILESF